MKKMICSALVVVLTFITLMVMVSFKTDYSLESINITEDKPISNDKPDGTGLMFDDYNKNINIPVNNQNSSVEKPKEEIKDQKGDKLNYNNYNRYKRLYEDYIAFNQEIPESENARYINDDEDLIYYSPSNNKKVITENQISMEDRVSLAKMASKLELQDINTIRKAIGDGANDMEARRIWNMLKDKLPEKDYERLVEIMGKYEK